MAYHDEAVQSALDSWKLELNQAYKDYSKIVTNLASLEAHEKEKRAKYVKDMESVRRHITKIYWILENSEYIFQKLEPKGKDKN